VPSEVAVHAPAGAGGEPLALRLRGLLLRRWHLAATLAVVVLAVLLWSWLAKVVNPILLAPPGDVWDALRTLTGVGAFWSSVGVTAREMAIGWAGGVAIGLALALVAVRWKTVRDALYPYVVVFSAVPKVVLLPLFAAWVGVGMPSTIMLTVVACFFPTYVSAFVGLSQTSGDALDLMRSLRAKPRQLLLMVQLPGALPMIFTGLKASMTVAALGAVVGEFYGARTGLGFLINSYATNLETPYVYAVIIALSLLALLLYFAVELLQRLVIRWPASP
jgi:NitT/TauT family transport system permease protein